ncbi:hypothetical protein C8F04DRAFT_1254547 [Mycena alexandri]|uniref:Uncharacterized protein n=1 Tax=Mycena alexandri TaxID=1745969 RepID=A0AAD6T5H6_9AGAR|nr:hypothetical protein C8F04DRAFT_1254547 [Mycena alexandri]
MDARLSTPTPHSFHTESPLPLPVVVLLMDTEIMPPVFPPLLADTDFRNQARRPIPGPTAGPTAPKSTIDPGRRATSPLTEVSDDEDHRYPPGAQPTIIPRPSGVQRNVETHLQIPAAKLQVIKTTIADAVPTYLDMKKSYSAQDGDALKKYTKYIQDRYPALRNYKDNWALQGLTTNFLKNSKPKMVRRMQNSKIAAINALAQE